MTGLPAHVRDDGIDGFGIIALVLGPDPQAVVMTGEEQTVTALSMEGSGVRAGIATRCTFEEVVNRRSDGRSGVQVDEEVG
jgi:hypothetical protein